MKSRMLNGQFDDVNFLLRLYIHAGIDVGGSQPLAMHTTPPRIRTPTNYRNTPSTEHNMQLWWQTRCEFIHWNEKEERRNNVGKRQGKEDKQLIDELLKKKKNYTDLKKTDKRWNVWRPMNSDCHKPAA